MFQQQRAYGAIQCGDGIVYETHLGKLNAAAGGGDLSHSYMECGLGVGELCIRIHFSR